MDKKLVEKFIINQTTPNETKKVLDWLNTEEGKQYFQERLDIDYDLMDRRELREMVPELDSEKMFKSIQGRIYTERPKKLKRKSDWFVYGFKVAAAFLVILLSSLFYLMNYTEPVDTVVEKQPILFVTADEQHREITLSDGSVVRLNSNSELTILGDFMQGTREIVLNGEAFFDVKTNLDQPFIIHANQSTVRVLGTSFNVRSFPGQDNVQVAVIEGRVSFTSKNAVDSDTHNENGVILTKGQYAYMDIKKSTFQVDDVAIENYLSWKNGTFVFEELPLQQVCLQLSRIYGTQCNFSDSGIRNLTLTAEFSNDSLEKTLSVISLSLNIEFEHNGKDITWFNEGS